MAPKWKQLADRLAEEIRSGARPPGSTLPQIPELVAAGEGSKATVNRAYKELEAWGYVTPLRGRGTMVRERPPARLPLSRYEPLLDPDATRTPWETAAAEQGLDGHTEPTTPADETLKAPADVAELLGLPAGAPVTRRRYRALIASDVVALHEEWYPLDVAQAAGLDTGGEGKTGALGALIGAGITPAEAEESITAEVPTPDQAAELGIGPRASVLLVDRVTRDDTGRAIELSRVTGAADRLRLVYSPLPLRLKRGRSRTT
ncbi:GntR family transcriptional regulator [Streptomyces klenkii]